MTNLLLLIMIMALTTTSCLAFTPPCGISRTLPKTTTLLLPSSTSRSRTTTGILSSTPTPDDDDSLLGEKFGGFTVKQRLREEVESPFRKVRLAFFAFSAASASVALYFSALAALKANIGGYADTIPVDDALVQVAINAGGAIGFGILAIREVQVGNKNLERIAKGGLLARLEVEQPAAPTTVDRNISQRRALTTYRQTSRVVIAAGGTEYINRLAMSLCSDQLVDENTIPNALAGVDTVIVPVLLNKNGEAVDSKNAWRNAKPNEGDRNFDSTRADKIVAFPTSFANWNQYLKSDIETAKGQGFDVLTNGITITVKKNGKILRRATGLPPYVDYIGMMEVADGNRFGSMPGDSELYDGA